MAVSFQKAVANEVDVDMFVLPPTDWENVIHRFIATNKKVAPLEFTGRDAHRSLSSVYTSINTCLRRARNAGKEYPVKVSRKDGKVYLYRTDLIT